MHRLSRPRIRPWLAVAGAAVLLAACKDEPAVSYTWDVYPILQQRCLPCHSAPDGHGYRMTGLDLETYEGLLRGSWYTRAVVPGDSRHSLLNMVAEGRVFPGARMHTVTKPMPPGEAEILRRWVDEGARRD
jgi:hypothetical protein